MAVTNFITLVANESSIREYSDFIFTAFTDDDVAQKYADMHKNDENPLKCYYVKLDSPDLLAEIEMEGTNFWRAQISFSVSNYFEPEYSSGLTVHVTRLDKTDLLYYRDKENWNNLPNDTKPVTARWRKPNNKAFTPHRELVLLVEATTSEEAHEKADEILISTARKQLKKDFARFLNRMNEEVKAFQ